MAADELRRVGAGAGAGALAGRHPAAQRRAGRPARAARQVPQRARLALALSLPRPGPRPRVLAAAGPGRHRLLFLQVRSLPAPPVTRLR